MDKKNTLLLTVIAIATLLVAIVGATFAYFTAQTGDGKDVKIDVTTETSDSSAYGTFEQINIHATQANFAQAQKQSLQGESKGFVSFTANSQTKSGTLCYTASIKVNSNDFEYSLPKTRGENTGDYYPELVLNLYKTAGKTGNAATNLLSEQFETAYTEETLPIDETHNLTYDASWKTGAKVCTTNTKSGEVSTCTEQADQTIGGYDITVVGNSAAPAGGGQGVDLTGVTTIQIPNTANLQDETKKFEHKITVASGDTPDDRTSSDFWKITVTFINYDDTDIHKTAGSTHEDDAGAQAGLGDQQKNTNKAFHATLQFTPKTACAE